MRKDWPVKDPNEKAHPVVNRTLQVARMQNARRKFTIGALELRLGFGAKIDISGVTRIEQDGRRTGLILPSSIASSARVFIPTLFTVGTAPPPFSNLGCAYARSAK